MWSKSNPTEYGSKTVEFLKDIRNNNILNDHIL